MRGAAGVLAPCFHFGLCAAAVTAGVLLFHWSQGYLTAVPAPLLLKSSQDRFGKSCLLLAICACLGVSAGGGVGASNKYFVTVMLCVPQLADRVTAILF